MGESFGEGAISLVEQVFAERKVGANSKAELESGQKRSRDRDQAQSALMEAAASWARPHIKRLRTAPSWPSAQPAAVAAVLCTTGERRHMSRSSSGAAAAVSKGSRWMKFKLQQHLGQSRLRC